MKHGIERRPVTTAGVAAKLVASIAGGILIYSLLAPAITNHSWPEQCYSVLDRRVPCGPLPVTAGAATTLLLLVVLFLLGLRHSSKG